MDTPPRPSMAAGAGPPAFRLARLLLAGGALTYGALNSLFNVEGARGVVMWVCWVQPGYGGRRGMGREPGHGARARGAQTQKRSLAHGPPTPPPPALLRSTSHIDSHLSLSLFSAKGGHRAIVFNRLTGIKDEVYEEGTHLMVPWLERPIIYDVRARPNVITSQSGSRDLQMVNIGLRVLTRPSPARLPEIYRTLGTDYAERVLPSIIQETLKSVIAQVGRKRRETEKRREMERGLSLSLFQPPCLVSHALRLSVSLLSPFHLQYNASQLLTQREVVSRDIRRILTQRAAYFNIVLDDVSITQLTFSKEYTSAVEAKQVAQQDAERAKFVVEKAEQDKQSAVIKAQGEAASARLIGEAVQSNPAFLTLRRIEAARDIAGVVGQGANRVFLSSDSLMLNLGDGLGDGKKK